MLSLFLKEKSEWDGILQYIYETVMSENNSGYIEVDDIRYVPAPTDFTSFIKYYNLTKED